MNIETVVRRKAVWIPYQEVYRGVNEKYFSDILYADWICSNCNCIVEDSKKPTWNYCPNCGIEMEKQVGFKMKGYKGTDRFMRCRGFQYEIGKKYRIDSKKVKLFENGFHFCEDLRNVFDFYEKNNRNRFFEVEASGFCDSDGVITASEEIVFIRELDVLEINRAFYGIGNGCGYGKGYGDGYGDGYGIGYGFGHGYGFGDGNGHGEGYRNGDGNGYGDGFGNGKGDGRGCGYGKEDGNGYGDGLGININKIIYF